MSTKGASGKGGASLRSGTDSSGGSVKISGVTSFGLCSAFGSTAGLPSTPGRREGDGGRGEGRAGKVGRGSKQQPRIKTRKQNKSVVYWLVGVCRTKSFKSWRGPKRRIHLPKGGPGSACSVPGRPMEEMLWTRRKSRRRRWKEDELDILSSVDFFVVLGEGRGGSIENVDRGSRRREGVVSPDFQDFCPQQNET